MTTRDSYREKLTALHDKLQQQADEALAEKQEAERAIPVLRIAYDQAYSEYRTYNELTYNPARSTYLDAKRALQAEVNAEKHAAHHHNYEVRMTLFDQVKDSVLYALQHWGAARKHWFRNFSDPEARAAHHEAADAFDAKVKEISPPFDDEETLLKAALLLAERRYKAKVKPLEDAFEPISEQLHRLEVKYRAAREELNTAYEVKADASKRYVKARDAVRDKTHDEFIRLSDRLSMRSRIYTD